jgi:hypothetical protein
MAPQDILLYYRAINKYTYSSPLDAAQHSIMKSKSNVVCHFNKNMLACL